MTQPEHIPSVRDRHHDKLLGFGREKIVLAIRGRWRDRIEYTDGRVEFTEWSPNQIQNNATVLTAALLRRYDEVPEGVGWDGLTYIALGTGDVSWDGSPPSQSAADTTLTTEVFRKAILPADFVFSDGAGTPIGGESRFILITVIILSGEANGNSLREFALFGGDATGAEDSGQIFNWVVHSRIDKDDTFSIQRQIELELLEP